MKWPLVVFLGTTACVMSEPDRGRLAAERRQLRAAGLATDVVKALQHPDTSDRLVYDPPPDLSYASLRLTRSDLVLAAEKRTR